MIPSVLKTEGAQGEGHIAERHPWDPLLINTAEPELHLYQSVPLGWDLASS